MHPPNAVDDLADEPRVVPGRAHDVDGARVSSALDHREHPESEVEDVLHLVVGHVARRPGSRAKMRGSSHAPR